MVGPQPPGQLLGDGTFVIPAPGEGSLLGAPPQRVPLPSVTFSPHRQLLINPVLVSRPPFTNGPFSQQLPAPPLPPRFRWQMGGPIPLQNQFGQRLPPGPPPPPQGFPGQLNGGFEDGPPASLGQFPVSVSSGVPEMSSMPAPPAPPAPPSGVPVFPHPPIPDRDGKEEQLKDAKFDKTLANLVVAQNLLTVMKDSNVVREPGRMPPPSVFKVPLPPGPPAKLLGRNRGTAPAADLEPSEDSTEVMDMDMSPLDDDCELELPTPPDLSDMDSSDKGKNSKTLPHIDLKALSNAIKRLTSQPVDDMPTSAVELTNKEKVGVMFFFIPFLLLIILFFLSPIPLPHFLKILCSVLHFETYVNFFYFMHCAWFCFNIMTVIAAVYVILILHTHAL